VRSATATFEHERAGGDSRKRAVYWRNARETYAMAMVTRADR